MTRAPPATACRPPSAPLRPQAWQAAKAETAAKCVATRDSTGTGRTGSTALPIRSGSALNLCQGAAEFACSVQLARSRSCRDLLADQTLGTQHARDFRADILAQPAIEREAGRVGRIARMWQVDRLDGLDRRTRPRRHGHDAVGQENGFPDVVRDEHDGAAGRAPDAVHFALKHFTRLRIER